MRSKNAKYELPHVRSREGWEGREDRREGQGQGDVNVFWKWGATNQRHIRTGTGRCEYLLEMGRSSKGRRPFIAAPMALWLLALLWGEVGVFWWTGCSWALERSPPGIVVMADMQVQDCLFQRLEYTDMTNCSNAVDSTSC